MSFHQILEFLWIQEFAEWMNNSNFAFSSQTEMQTNGQNVVAESVHFIMNVMYSGYLKLHLNTVKMAFTAKP